MGTAKLLMTTLYFFLMLRDKDEKEIVKEPLSVLDQTPLGFCSQLHLVSNISSVFSSVQCHLILEEAKNNQGTFTTPENLWMPIVYCSQVIHVSNITSVISSVRCYLLPTSLTKGNRKFEENLLVPKWFCSKVDYRNGSSIFYSSVQCSHLNKEKQTEPFISPTEYDMIQNDETQIFEVLLYTIFTASCIGNTVIYLASRTLKRKTPVRQDWDKLQKETKQKLEEVLQYRNEAEKRQKKRREEMARESERRGHETMLTLIRSLTLPLLEETRNFNEWMESPD